MTVADLIRLAEVSKRTFYEHFDSKEACLLASFEEMLAEPAARVIAAYSAERDPLAAIGAAYQTFVGELIEGPPRPGW